MRGRRLLGLPVTSTNSGVPHASFPRRSAGLHGDCSRARRCRAGADGVDNQPVVWATAFSGIHDAETRHALVVQSYPTSSRTIAPSGTPTSAKTSSAFGWTARQASHGSQGTSTPAILRYPRRAPRMTGAPWPDEHQGRKPLASAAVANARDAGQPQPGPSRVPLNSPADSLPDSPEVPVAPVRGWREWRRRLSAGRRRRG